LLRHPELIAAFDAGLRGGALPAGVTARVPEEAARRFDVYRNNVAVGLTEALATRFPVIRRLVGEEFFAALARLYAESDRPRSPVLAEWGVGFADFLAGFPPLAGWPYMADVARIEFARGVAFHAADARPVNPATLVTADPDRLRLRLHPSVMLLRLSHPAVSIWARNQPGGEGVALTAGPETALILRDVGFAVHVSVLGPGDAALAAGLLGGETLAEAAARGAQAEPGHDPQPFLVTLMRAGAISEPEA
jgi:hypothetical protein